MDGCENPLTSGDAGLEEQRGGERPSCEVRSRDWKFCFHTQATVTMVLHYSGFWPMVPGGDAQRHTILAFGTPGEGRMSRCVGRRISAQWGKENGEFC